MDDWPFNLLNPGGSGVANFPGTQKTLLLKAYKEEIGKTYQRITICIRSKNYLEEGKLCSFVLVAFSATMPCHAMLNRFECRSCVLKMRCFNGLPSLLGYQFWPKLSCEKGSWILLVGPLCFQRSCSYSVNLLWLSISLSCESEKCESKKFIQSQSNLETTFSINSCKIE